MIYVTNTQWDCWIFRKKRKDWILLDERFSQTSSSDKSTYLIKFADDCTLLVPEHSNMSIQQEIIYIREWAEKNKISINMSMTKEIVFHRPHPSKYSLPNVFSVFLSSNY